RIVGRSAETGEGGFVVDQAPSPRRVAAVDVDVAVFADGEDLSATKPAHAGGQGAVPRQEAADFGHAEVRYLAAGIQVMHVVAGKPAEAEGGVHVAVAGGADAREAAGRLERVPGAQGVAEFELPGQDGPVVPVDGEDLPGAGVGIDGGADRREKT